MSNWNTQSAEVTRNKILALVKSIKKKRSSLLSIKNSFSAEFHETNFIVTRRSWYAPWKKDPHVNVKWSEELPANIIASYKSYLNILYSAREYIIIDTGSGNSNLYNLKVKKDRLETAKNIAKGFGLLNDCAQYRTKMTRFLTTMIKEINSTITDLQLKIEFLDKTLATLKSKRAA